MHSSPRLSWEMANFRCGSSSNCTPQDSPSDPQNDLDYMDDNAERLGRQKMRSDAMKRQFAVHGTPQHYLSLLLECGLFSSDYKRTQKALATCQFCYGEDDSLPKAPVVAMGTRAYLSCTLNEELLDGHCLIVPIQHHLTMLEADDDVWDEVRVRNNT